MSSSSMSVDLLLECPGRYCGIYKGICAGCPRGHRVNITSNVCEPCSKNPRTYEWLYLGFMVLVVIYFNIELLIRLHSKTYAHTTICNRVQIKGTLKWIVITLGEVIVAAIITLLLADPKGQMRLHACNVESILDWYSIFQNPTIKFTETIYCNSEVVYPLFSIIFTFLGFCLICMLLLRSWFKPTPFTTESVYASLYFLPAITIIHSTLCGLIYYSYPYLCITGSLIFTAILMAKNIENYSDIPTNIRKFSFISQVVMHWILHGYGILAVATYYNLSRWYLILTPLPTVFYFLTMPFSIPVSVSYVYDH